jgi:hypothetical protein
VLGGFVYFLVRLLDGESIIFGYRNSNKNMKTNNKLLIFISLICAGCAGKIEYVKPTTSQRPSNSITVIASRDKVWDSAIPKLSKQFFVINNLEKASGLISLSYSGNPESYVDCGKIISYVKNLRGERTYDFPASKAEQQYEIMTSELFRAYRKMSLEGRINLIFEEAGANETRITANIKYILSRTFSISDALSHTNTQSDAISFNSGGSASFAGGTECTPTGKLEYEILQAVQF